MAIKAQSAMEYLMTYGWAILVIAVVLGALFSLGIFSSSSFLSTGCIATSGHLCQNPLLVPGLFANGQASNDLLTVTLGQSTGAILYCGFYAIAPLSAALNNYGYPTGSSIVGNVVGAIPSGTTNVITFLLPNSGTSWPPNTLGTTLTGTIWVNYSLTSQPCTSSANTVAKKVATIIVKVA